ncbi:MAG: hypothetical protein Q9161_003306 [Pseudevernia consocians]
MRGYSAGKQWEDLNRKRQEAENQELEAQRAAASQAVRAQVGGLPSLASLNATLPVRTPRYFQDLRSRFLRSQDEVPELEVQEDPPPQYRQQAPLTPPTSDVEIAEMDSNEHIRHLQRDFEQKESKIKRLESKVEVEKDKRRRLQAERHEAVDAQRRAEDELRKLKRQVENLDQLLDGSIKRQKELESELDLCRQESRDLKRQLHDERCSYESDIRARETWERQTAQQVEDKSNALENGIRKDRRADREEESALEGDVRSKKSPQRRNRTR